jgi:DNA-binding GntR family transcriptional regulator
VHVTSASTKADDIALALEDDIVSGRVAAGTVLRQEQLSERFGVSRTPIREALRRLAALGLVSFVPNRGVRVRTLSRDELREAFLVRAELESLATELAVPRMTDADVAALDEAEKRFAELTVALRAEARGGIENASLAVEWMNANYAFHDVIYSAAGLPYLERVSKAARRTFIGQITWVARAELDEHYARNDREHRAIREAIAAGSAHGARALAREHVLHSWELLVSVLDHVDRGRGPAELRSA